MKQTPARNRYIAFFCSFLIGLPIGFSCTSETKTAETVATVSSPMEPTDKQLLEIGIQKLDQWASYWKKKGADVQAFELEQEYVYEPLEWPGENVFLEDSPLKNYQIPHPAAEGVVDIYSYKLVLNEDGELNFNPDSEVVYYRSDGMRERLLFIGPSGVFEDAVWVTEDHLLVSGHIQKEDGFVPVVWLINPEAHKYAVYESNFYTQDHSSESYLIEKLKSLDIPL
jgi:hypothetical protein